MVYRLHSGGFGRPAPHDDVRLIGGHGPRDPVLGRRLPSRRGFPQERDQYRSVAGGVVWCGVVWCGVVWCGVVWCGVVWCGVVWCGVVWCVLCWDVLCCAVLCCAVLFGVVHCHCAPFPVLCPAVPGDALHLQSPISAQTFCTPLNPQSLSTMTGPTFNRRLRCSSCGFAVREQEFHPDELFAPHDQRRCALCVSRLPPPSPPPARALSPHRHPMAPYEAAPPGGFVAGSPRAYHPGFAPGSPTDYPPPPVLSDADYLQAVMSVHGWLGMCEKTFDPDPRVIRRVRVRSHVQPREWFAGHPSAAAELAPLPYESGSEVATRYVGAMLHRARYAKPPVPLLDAIRDFVDTHRPLVTQGKCFVRRDLKCVEEHEALFFSVGWRVWSLEYQEVYTAESVPRWGPLGRCPP